MTLPPAEAIFLALADVHPDDRAAFLDERCAGNAALRREVEGLISSLDLPRDDFLDPERVPTLDMAAVDGPLQPGTTLGNFLVLQRSGRAAWALCTPRSRIGRGGRSRSRS